MAALKEQFEFDEVAAPYAGQAVVIAEKFASEFGDWIGNYLLDLTQGKSKVFYQSTAEALEQFKKEKGL